jgi:hypothetical protein
MRLLLVLIAGCGAIADYDDVYTRGPEEVVCAISLDDRYAWGYDDVVDALDRAAEDGTTLHVYAHRPGSSVQTSRIEALVGSGFDRGLRFVTYREEAEGAVKLSFDDDFVSEWWSLREMLARFGARVTFFVTRYHALDDVERAALADLAGDGHAIEYHGTNHRNAVEFVDGNGLDAYLAEEIDPDLALMRADGYDPIAFAYPFGERSDAIDTALLERFALVRAIHHTCPR